MIKIKHKGNFEMTTKFLKIDRKKHILKVLEKYGKKGVDALSKATPVDTGKTAASWTYYARVYENSASIHWENSNRNNGVPIALMIQYGHAMPNGG